VDKRLEESEIKLGKELYEFGPFRADADKELLLRGGEPIPLTPKAFQILLVLLRNNKELVTKDELMKKVWPDTFVEEANLSRNVFLLRKALGEDSTEHRYIITVPGRGYRLAENVRTVPEHEISLVAASHSKIQVRVQESKPWPWIATGTALVVLVSAAVFLMLRPHSRVIGEKDTVVIADFANTTGDAVFDGTLRQGLSVQLQQSPYLSVVSDERIHHTLQLMGSAAETRLSERVARDVCARTQSAAILEGSIGSLGQQYVIGLKAIDCQTGDVFDEEQAQAARKEDVLAALTQIASKFRTRVGESLATIEKHNMPLVEATTESLEALRAYSLGWQHIFGADGAADAIPYFKRAIELDPNFASAYGMVGRAYADMGESASSAEYLTKAYSLRNRTSDRERFFITVNYESLVTGDIDKAREVAEVWEETYPRDFAPRTFLSYLYQQVGKYEKSGEAGRAAVAVDPDAVPAYANLAWAYVLLDKYKEAEATVQSAIDRKLDFPDLHLLQYDLAFLKGDEAGMQAALAAAGGKTGAEHWVLQRESCVLAYSGRMREAEIVSRNAARLAAEANQKERAALYLAAVASREALLGNATAATETAESALKLNTGRDVEYGAAFALALSLKESKAAALMADLEKRFPQDTYVKFSYVPTVHAVIAMNHGENAKAVEELQSAARFDLAIEGTWAGFFGEMYPVYVRGQAYLANHEGQKAAQEFEKIVAHRGVVGSDFVAPMGTLQLARAYVAGGDVKNAKLTYEKFFQLWKNADANMEVLGRARSEYAALQ
jgi:DNA-binding winged helix-turn-helix (wHTH) protein/tetratricopeptide (TPR) repeat protein